VAEGGGPAAEGGVGGLPAGRWWVATMRMVMMRGARAGGTVAVLCSGDIQGQLGVGDVVEQKLKLERKSGCDQPSRGKNSHVRPVYALN
jgi:hypothetical protein